MGDDSSATLPPPIGKGCPPPLESQRIDDKNKKGGGDERLDSRNIVRTSVNAH